MRDGKVFRNRLHAGKLLAQRLARYARDPTAVVLALPRGGVPVGFAVAKALALPLDILLVRKLGAPRHDELAIGAVGIGGLRVLEPAIIAAEHVSDGFIEAATEKATAELARRDRLYRGGRPPPAIAGRTTILVDDGLATGATMRAAVAIVRRHGAARIVAAVPVGAADSLAALAPQVDELACLIAPPDFRAVGQWYRDFAQTGDEETQDLLAMAWREQARHAAATPP